VNGWLQSGETRKFAPIGKESCDVPFLKRNYVYLDTLKMNDQSMRIFIDALTVKPPSMLFGHAHSLYLFATFLRCEAAECKGSPQGRTFNLHGSA